MNTEKIENTFQIGFFIESKNKNKNFSVKKLLGIMVLGL